MDNTVRGKFTRRELFVLSTSAAAYAFGTTIVSASWRQRAKRIIGETSKLARACYTSWNDSGDYKPELMEVESWLRTIEAKDRIIKDTKFYASMIDHESLGDPTSHNPKNDTRGLGRITRNTGNWICEKYNMKVGTMGTALFNPHFNISVMVMLIEYYHMKSPWSDREKYALMCYGYGEAAIKRGDDGSAYYAEHKERYAKIKGLMKGDLR